MSETLIGVIIGGVLTLLGGILGAWIQYHLRKKDRLYEQKAQAYETLLRVVMQIVANRDYGNALNDIADASVKVQLYGTIEINDIYEKILVSLQPKEDQEKFLEDVKKVNENLSLLELQKLIKEDLKR